MSDDTTNVPPTESFEDMMDLVVKLGNHQLVAEVKYALEHDGITPTPDFCKAAFVGLAYMIELADRAHDAGSLSQLEMVAVESVISVGLQVWATLHEQLVTGNIE